MKISIWKPKKSDAEQQRAEQLAMRSKPVYSASTPSAKPAAYNYGLSDAEQQRAEQLAMRAKPAYNASAPSAKPVYSASAPSAKPVYNASAPSAKPAAYDYGLSDAELQRAEQLAMRSKAAYSASDPFSGMSETEALRLEQRAIREVNTLLQRNPQMTVTAETYRDALVGAIAKRNAAGNVLPAAIPKEFAGLAGLVAKLPEDFPIEGWHDLTAGRQQQIISKTDLTRQEQWAILNAGPSIDTIALILDIEANKAFYGLTQRQVNEITAKLWEIGDLRTGVRNHDMPFSHDGRANARFMADLDRQQAELLGSFGYGDIDDGAEVWYDDAQGKHAAARRQPTASPSLSPNGLPNAPFPVFGPIRYPEEGSVAYVFYTSSLGAEFSMQAAYQKKKLERAGCEVKMICVDDVESFTDEWNNMDAKTSAAVIICHSNGMSLMFEEGTSENAISATGANRKGNPLPAIGDLKGPELGWLYILACNAGHEELLEARGTNVADAFRDLPNVDTVYAYDGSVSFGIPLVKKEAFMFPRLGIRDQDGYHAVYENFDIDLPKGRPTGRMKYESE